VNGGSGRDFASSQQTEKGFEDMTSISNYDNMIDSREVIERIEELTSYEITEAETEELESLVRLQSEASDYCEDWEYGAQLIRDSYFEEYARELADDLGMIIECAAWPMSCIDWEQAARELQMDYTAIEFDGVTYWVR
jgi:hypothetical protein